MTIKLLVFTLLAVVKETLGSSSRYTSAPVPVETLLALGVASKNYSGVNDVLCALRAALDAPPCPAPFDWVPDVGCVAVVETNRPYDVAKTSCPGGSQLVSLYSDNFFKLAAYVYQKSFVPKGWSGGWCFVGLHRNNLVWTWRTGQVMSGLPGSGLWGPLEPNDNSDCAFLLFVNGAPYLGDRACTIPSWSVCALQ
ncbi:uncharacterized protein LOC108666489 [Hyalella azteca]|uniref:Uncharacterized protein LOC108666489 n=1 Tax=Hyalella azteca TaxID=294128 RepID=A0A8B7N6E7_HYAAZ|nr:uncharacterized protein LOC108666489 [Hyalella azteca]